MQRRKFTRLSAELMAVLPLLSTTNPIAFKSMNLDYDTYEFKIGKYSCKIFKDLMFKYLGKDYFINASAEEVSKELARYQQQPDNIPSPFIALLLEQGKEKILVDTGIGYFKEPLQFRGNTYKFQGRLLEILAKENINKNEITQVVLTHLHPDHIGGIYNESGTVNFPNAQFVIHEDEWNYWHSSSSDKQPPLFKLFIEKNIEGLENKNLLLVKGEEQAISPNITAILSAGHTPGQIALKVASENDRLLYISDAFLHPLHIEQLNWQTNYDLNHELAKDSRKRLLELAYKENMLINAFHFDFPGLGNVDKIGGNWKWIYQKAK